MSELRRPDPEEIGAANATWCATLVDEWVRAGLTDAVVCPGSRSTPLALALASRSEVSIHVHHDERAGAFTALGLGLVTGRPAVVVTTSGTAAVEAHPAVVEADLACVPLLVATADRPPELHDVGAPQTVDQRSLFGRAVRWYFQPGPPDPAAMGSWRSMGARPVAEATGGAAGPGPVHLDLAFREPLLGEPADLSPGRGDGAPWHSVGGRRLALDRSGTERLAELLGEGPGVVVAGAGAGDPEVVLALADAVGWPVLADPRSGCRRGHPAVIAYADAILRHGPTAAELRPAAVLRLGAPPASKVLATWLKESDARQVAVDGHGRWYDADRSAAHVLHADPTAVASALSRLIDGAPGSWLAGWAAADAAAEAAVARVLDGRPDPTEPGVAHAVSAASAAAGARLVVSSSMPIRDVEWFGGKTGPLPVLANRGANGIDGVLSTAVGVALAGRRGRWPTVALLGDVALLHDSNALLGLAGREVDLTVVVVDNDGGGIFSFLPPAAALAPERFEQLFGTPHGVDLAGLVRAHGLALSEPTSAAEVRSAVDAAIAAGGTQVIRVRTDRAANVAFHDELHAAVVAAL